MPDPNLATNIAAQPPAPYQGKTVYYHSGLSNVSIIYSSGGGPFTTANLSVLGPGRSAGEFLYRGSGIGSEGESIQFVMTGFVGTNQIYDKAPYGGYGDPGPDYFTELDVFFLQDGHIYNYWPAPSNSAPLIVGTNFTSSYTGNGIASRNGRVYLPRGYQQNAAWKRYPVLYMHDGANIFHPGGPFGAWGGEHAANREISQGRMRETIIVEINNTPSRLSEYGTPQDGYTGNYYLLFVLSNVIPKISQSYVTLTNVMDTGVMGSSLGGLISAYMGLATNRFGLVGAMSPSYWYGPNFRGWIQTNATKGNRIYQDCGTAEGASMWDYFWPVRGYYFEDGYVENHDFKTVVGCGDAHNEAAWSNRLGGAYRYLYNVLDEPNRLAQQTYPPVVTSIVWRAGSNGINLGFSSLRGFAYRLDAVTNPIEGDWQGVATGAVETLPWRPSDLFVTNPVSPMDARFLRVTATN